MTDKKNLNTPYYDAIVAMHMQGNNVKIVFGNQDMEEILQAQGTNKQVLPKSAHTVVLPISAFLYTTVRFMEDPRNADMISKMKEFVQNEMSGGADTPK